MALNHTPMALQSLLLTTDPEALRQLRSVLRDLGIGVEVCQRAAQASECLRRRHFDVAVLDSETAQAESVIAQLRAAPSSRSAPLFLIGPTDASSPAPFASQADYLLSRPLTLEQTWRALRGARQQMESTMLRYFRARIDAPALLLRSDGSTVEGRTRDVGQGGAGIQAAVALCRGEILVVRLELPGCREAVQAQAEVVWAGHKGKAGLRFLLLEDPCRSALEAWIARGLGQREFAFVFSGTRDTPEAAFIPVSRL